MPENRRGLRRVKGGAGVKREALGNRRGVTGCRGARVAFWDVEEGAGGQERVPGDRGVCRRQEANAGLRTGCRGRLRVELRDGLGRAGQSGAVWEQSVSSPGIIRELSRSCPGAVPELSRSCPRSRC